MQIEKTRHSKIYVVLGKMKNEDSRGQKTLQREELCSQVPRHLTLKQTPKKTKKTGRICTKAPRHAEQSA